MPVDLSKLRAGRKPGHKEGYRPEDPHVEVLDRVHLRKSWKRTGATYWVELLWHTKQRCFQVRKTWKWFKGSAPSEGWVQGEVWFGRPLSHRQVDEVVDSYKEALTTQFEKDYVIADHERAVESPIPSDGPEGWQKAGPRAKAPPPAPSTPRANPLDEIFEAMDAADEADNKPEKKPIMRRKAERDWW